MPKLTKETEEYNKSRIRGVLVVNPRASLREIQETLEKSETAPLYMHLHYIGKLKKKIIGERAHRNNNLLVGARIAQMQDKKERIDRQLWAEATNPANSDKARVTALGALIKSETSMLQAEMDAGLFERKLGTVEHTPKPLTAEQTQRVLAAFAAWGIIQEPKHVNAKIIEHKKT